MKPTHLVAALGAFTVAAAFALPALAQMAHGHDHMAAAAQTGHQDATAQGEVRKIDVENRKLTLQHAASKDMGMPAMTMVYRVADGSLLRNVRVGDKVRFRTASAGGSMTITELQPVH